MFQIYEWKFFYFHFTIDTFRIINKKCLSVINYVIILIKQSMHVYLTLEKKVIFVERTHVRISNQKKYHLSQARERGGLVRSRV